MVLLNASSEWEWRVLLWLVVFLRYCGLFWGNYLGSCCLQPAARLCYEHKFLPPQRLGYWGHDFGAWVSISAGIPVSIAGWMGVKATMYWEGRSLGRGKPGCAPLSFPPCQPTEQKAKRPSAVGKEGSSRIHVAPALISHDGWKWISSRMLLPAAPWGEEHPLVPRNESGYPEFGEAEITRRVCAHLSGIDK